MRCQDYALRASRDKVFDRLCEIWSDTKTSTDPDTRKEWHDDIWRKANTLQAVARYWSDSRDTHRRQHAMDLMLDGYAFYRTRQADESLWVDDFGWWAGFFVDLMVQTRDAPLAPPFDQHTLLIETENCYTRMLRNLDRDHGGIWNHRGDGGEKNTVTNLWMLNVAANLLGLTGRAEYRTAADAQYAWLMTGRHGPRLPDTWHVWASNGTLLWLPGPDGTAGTSGWSGNDGVFVRGVSAYIAAAHPPDRQDLFDGAKAVITAAMEAGADSEAVMHEYPDSMDWSNDLATGKGIFMRLATTFAQQHDFFDDQSFRGAFKAFVGATAQSAWCSRDRAADATAPNWNPGFPTNEDGQPRHGGLWPQVWQTDGLDALNAAVCVGV
jgi:hypothetical protein